MFNGRRFLACLVAMVFAAVFPVSASAQVAIDGGSGLFHMQKARTLGHLNFGVGLYYESDNHDLTAPTGKGNETDFGYMPISATLGVGDNLEFSVSAPYSRVEVKKGTSESGMGDGIGRVKWNFLTSENFGVRMSALAFTTLPFGDKDKGLGTGKTNPGAGLALDKEYESVTWHASVGYQSRQEDGLDPQVQYGAGVEYMPMDNLSFIAEVGGYNWTKQVAGRDDQTMVTGGVRYYISDWASLTVGYSSWGGGTGESSPNYMYLAGITVGSGLGQPRGKLGVKEAAAMPGAGEAGAGEAGAGEAAGGEKVTIVLESIHFEFDKSRLTKEAQEILVGTAEKLNANPNVELVIEGHTCSIGSNGYNQALGMRRANSARKFLVEHGVKGERIDVISYGEEKPAHTNKTREGRKMNRRADFVIKVK